MTIHLPFESALALAMAMTDPHTTLLLRRYAAEQAVEDLINFLDDTEGDPDLELSGDEREASWPEGNRGFLGGAHNEDDEDTHDAEALNEDGGNITDEPHDDNELDDCPSSDWPSQSSMMTDLQKAEVRRETRRLLRSIPKAVA